MISSRQFVPESFFRILHRLTEQDGFVREQLYKISDPAAGKALAKALVVLQMANRRFFQRPLPVGYLFWAAKRVVEGNKLTPEQLLCQAYSTLFIGTTWMGRNHKKEILIDEGRDEEYLLN